MSDQAPLSSPASAPRPPTHDKSNKSEPDEKPSPVNIRTMSSDIDELLKTSRPTVSQMITREAPRPSVPVPIVSASRRNWGPVVTLILGVLLIGGLVVGGVWYLLPGTNAPVASVPNPVPGMPPVPVPPGVPTPTPAPAPVPPPQPLFQTDASRTITVSLDDRPGFLKLVTDTMQEPEKPGTLKRILIKLRDKQGEHYAARNEFFDLWHIAPPQNFFQHTDPGIMFFVYYGADGPWLGFVTRTRDASRTLGDIFAWEQSLISDLGPLFFQEQIKQPDPPLFEDRTFSNTDWRYLKLSSQKDLGIGYMVFQATRLVVFTTSKTSMENIIKILYGTQ